MPLANNQLLQRGADWVLGAVQRADAPRGVANPFGAGASAYEPNTVIYDPSNDPLMKGNSQRLEGVDAVDQAAQQAAAQASAASSAGGSLSGNIPFADLFQQAATKYNVPASLLAAVARAESNFNVNARSSLGATGLMQFMPGTAKGLGVNPLDPASSINGAAQYLSQLYSQFGRWDYALAAYNAGPGAVQSYNGIPPYAETESYVQRVTQYEQQYAGATANAQGSSGNVPNGNVGAFINAAKSLLGKPYVWGGTTAAGVDCSGLLYYAFNQAGIKMPRYRAVDYGQMGQEVSPGGALPGDIVYWDEPGSTDHVGIYLGSGMVLNSPHTGTVVQINKLWGNPTFRRIISDNGFGHMATSSGGSVLAYNGQSAGQVFLTQQPTVPQTPQWTASAQLSEVNADTGFKNRAL